MGHLGCFLFLVFSKERTIAFLGKHNKTGLIKVNTLKQLILFVLISVFLWSCSEKEKESQKILISFSDRVDSILKSESVNKKIVDSLYTEFKKSKSDTGKISALLGVMHAISYKKANVINDAIISAAKQIGYTKALYTAYLSKLYLFANLAQKDSVEYYHGLIRSWAEKRNDIAFIIQDQIYYGLAKSMQRELGESDSILLHAIEIINKTDYQNHYHIALAYHYLGKNKNIEFDNNAALVYLAKGGKHSELAKADELTSEIYFRSGECYLMESDYNNALEAYGKSMEFAQKAGDEQNIASNLGAMGEIYIYKEDYEKAKDFLFKSLDLSKKIGYTYQEAYTAATIGSLFFQDSSYTDALNYFNESNRLYSSYGKQNHSFEIVRNNLCIGEVFLALNQIDDAFRYIEDICNTPEFKEDPGIAAETLTNLSEIYFKKKDLNKAEQLAFRSLELSKENDLATSIQTLCQILYKIYEQKRNFERAHYYYKEYARLSDSLTNKTQIKKFAELENDIRENQLKAEHDKKEAGLINEKLQKEGELKRQRVTNAVITVGFVVLLFFAVLIYRSLQENKKKTKIISEQKQEVEQQKEIIEEKKKEVMDSIVYAKKIQEAILPSEESIKKIFPESFVLYRPKDIVAGDFYWLEKINETVLIAAADCTGHGVPGAMVSVVCSNALNRAVKEFGLSDPGLILNKVREIIIDTFDKSGSVVKDGMDISLMAVSEKETGDKIIVKWAGANNPLWYIKDKTLFEIKANKQPVGRFIRTSPFTTQTVELKKGDLIFLITDGFADQFGGPKGKKFKYKNLKEQIVANAYVSMDNQCKSLSEKFENWKQDLEQIDDVTIVGIKL